MLFHWYWPFARQEELAWAAGTVRPGEFIVVEVIDRDAAPLAQTEGPVRVVRDLPDVDRAASGAAWAVSRMRTYTERERSRRARWNRDQPDLVHLHYVNRFTDAIAAVPRPLVMSMHDLAPHVPRLSGRSERLLLARTYRRADALIVHHEILARSAAASLALDESRVHVIPHQVFPVPDPAPLPESAQPTVLLFGALRQNKGLTVMRQALSLLGDADLRVVVAGRGEKALETFVRQWADSDPRVRAEVGFVPLERKHELFRESSLVVLPYTQFSSQSGVLQDAYGHGRPVVVTDVGALGESVRADGTGIVIPPNDPTALAWAIRHLLESAQLSTYADAARLVARQRTPQATGTLLRAVYDQVLTTQ